MALAPSRMGASHQISTLWCRALYAGLCIKACATAALVKPAASTLKMVAFLRGVEHEQLLCALQAFEGVACSGLPFSDAQYMPNIKRLHATPAFSDQTASKTAEPALATVALSTPCQSIKFLLKYMHLFMCNVLVLSLKVGSSVNSLCLSVKYQVALYL